MEQIKKAINSGGATRLVIAAFVLALIILMPIMGLHTPAMLSNALTRIGMNGILVLAMVPSILCGIGVNYGLPVGIVCGLLGGICSLEWGLVGWEGFLAAILIAIPCSTVFGLLYALLLNRVKGSEGIIATYVGFSIVAFFCILCLVLPFKNPAILWPQGAGVRNLVSIADSYEKVLDNILAINIGEFSLPTGMLLLFGLMCFLIWLFMRSRTGLIMKAVGQNPLFAHAAGVEVNRYRVIGMMISTVLAAIGIIVYSQSYGFYSLYAAPQKMAFPAIAAVLIGGANNRKVGISNVVVGTILYQCMVTFSLPVANAFLPNGSISEVVRMIVSNGIILIALTKESKK